MHSHRQLRSFAALIVVLSLSCSKADSSRDEPSPNERQAIADSIRNLLTTTYVFDGTDPVPRFMKLYADTGTVVSAASGGFTESRDSVRNAIASFWNGAGQFMQQPVWAWGAMQIDVLSRNAVAVTARYTIPHWTPQGRPHVLGGVWTSVWTHRNGRWVIVQEHLSDLPREVAERAEATMPKAPPPPPPSPPSGRSPSR
jgi:ketosteroid isomerase-like protein